MRIFASTNLDKPECVVSMSNGDGGVTGMANVVRLAALRGALRIGVDVSSLYRRADDRAPIRAFTTDRSPVLLHAV